MSKDRFVELQENIEKNHDGIDLSVINHFAVINMDGTILDLFFYRVNTLRNSINQLAGLVEDHCSLQNAMLAPLILLETKERLERTMMEVRILAYQIRKELIHLREMYENEGKDTFHRIIELQVESMTRKFCLIMEKYYQSIVIYRERCKQRVQRQYQIAGLVKSDEEIEEILENDSFSIYPQITIETKRTKEELNLVKLRQDEIKKLENTIEDIHEMFCDMAYLIASQVNHIDQIQINVERAEENTKKFPKKKSTRVYPYKFSKRRMMIRLFSFCI